MTENTFPSDDTSGSGLSYAEIQRLGGELMSRPEPGDGVAGGRRVRVALTGSFTINPLAAALAVDCHALGIRPSFHVDGYDQYRASLLNGDSPLYDFRPDVVFLAVELESLLLLSGRPPGEAELPAEASRQVCQLVDVFKTHSTALLVIFDFVAPVRFPFAISGDRPGALHQAVNERLHQDFADDPQVRILNYDRLASYHGKRRTTNPKMHHMGRLEISETFLPLVSRQCLAYIRSLKGPTGKCLVLDLDGTLWGGVVGEDGLEGISLQQSGHGSEYHEWQKAILELSNKGVILALNSKNNPDDALDVLRNHPDMVLREEQFASIQINWNDKASNMRAIAEELNIGLDSLVFLDNDPVERAWVRHALPEVAVYDLPVDATRYARFLEELTDFEVLTITEEDRHRGAMYAAERTRKQLEHTSGSYEEFLDSLQMELTVGPARGIDLPRIAQLTRKTNQFNLRPRAYADAEIADMEKSSQFAIYALKVQDVFGDSGLVGTAIMRHSGPTLAIDSFLMSCRVLGRGIEHVFLKEIVARAKEGGLQNIHGEYVPTGKNGLISNFLDECGFKLVAQGDQGATQWELNMEGWGNSSSPRHKVKWPDGGLSD